MKEKLRNILIFIVIIALIGWLTIFPSENSSKDYNTNIKDNFSDVEELHWSHMPVTYFYQESCIGPIIPKINWAFSIIENKTHGKVSFEKVNSRKADINIICHKEQNIKALIYIDVEEYTYGLTEPKIIGNIIEDASINFWSVDEKKNPPDCYNFPRLELHEILHAFGFDHVDDNQYSIMYPYSIGCVAKEDNITVRIIATNKTVKAEDKIDDEIISCLEKIYSNNQQGSCSDVNFLAFCPSGQVLGQDDLCHEKCGIGYCPESSSCCNNVCFSCQVGAHLSEDCNCYKDGG